jgi:hypothetical protein
MKIIAVTWTSPLITPKTNEPRDLEPVDLLPNLDEHEKTMQTRKAKILFNKGYPNPGPTKGKGFIQTAPNDTGTIRGLGQRKNITSLNSVLSSDEHHCTRNTCPGCGSVQTCRCRTPITIETTNLCYYCLHPEENRDPLAGLK